MFCDYFRAGDTGSVVSLMARTGGRSPLKVHSGQAVPADGVAGVDPAVALGKLVALILDLEWEPGMLPVRPVWPAGLGWHEGPWVLDIGEVALHALAGLDDTRIPAVAAQWSLAAKTRDHGDTREQKDTRGQGDGRDAEETVEGLASLARRASAAGERLYCWVGL